MTKSSRSQALVEFALILPILLFTLLGSIEVGFLLITKAHQDRATYLVAQWAAAHDNDSWRAVANRELPGCTVEISSPMPDLTQATSRCLYHPKVLVGFPIFVDLPMNGRETSTSANNPPSATPVGSPSSS